MSELAYCDRSGTIGFTRGTCPFGMLPIARTPGIREIVSPLARHSYPDPFTKEMFLLVPGVPEADTDDAALDAVFRFRDLVEARIRSRNND